MSWMIRCLTLSLLMGCVSCVFTPWGTNVPDSYRDLNKKNIEKIATQNRPDSDGIKFIVISDPQGSPLTVRALIKKINARPDVDDFAFITVLGDFTNQGLQMEYQMMIESLLTSDLPFLGIVGNHDLISKGKTLYTETFGEMNFSFAAGGVKFIAYNDNRLEMPEVPDYRWLAGQLEGDSNRLATVVMAHTPWLETTDTDERTAIKQLFQSFGVDLAIFGHVHEGGFFETFGMKMVEVGQLSASNLNYAVVQITNDRQVVIERCDYECHSVTYQSQD